MPRKRFTVEQVITKIPRQVYCPGRLEWIVLTPVRSIVVRAVAVRTVGAVTSDVVAFSAADPFAILIGPPDRGGKDGQCG